MGKAQVRRTEIDRTNSLGSRDRELYGMGRMLKSRPPGTAGSGQSISPAQSISATGNFLKRTGDTMTGPIALGTAFVTGVSNVITVDGSSRRHFNVGKTGFYSSNTYVFPSSGFSDTLDYIDGDVFDGQLLKIHVQASYTITFNSSLNVTGNILTPTNLATTVTGPAIVNLIFDSTLGTSGCWQMESSPGGGGSIVLTESWDYALSDESGALTLNFVVTDGTPYNYTITDVQAYLVIPGGGAQKVTVDILAESGTNTNIFSSIFSTKLTIDNGSYTSVGASVPFSLSTTSLVKGRRLQYKISQVDTNGTAQGLKVILIGHQ